MPTADDSRIPTIDRGGVVATVLAGAVAGLLFAADLAIAQTPAPDVEPVARVASQPAGHLAAGPETRPTSQGVRPRDDPRVIGWTRTLFWGFVLFLVLGIAAIALIVFSSRYKAYLQQLMIRRRATPSEDVWSMHRPPADDESDVNGGDGDPPGGGGGN